MWVASWDSTRNVIVPQQHHADDNSCWIINYFEEEEEAFVVLDQNIPLAGNHCQNHFRPALFPKTCRESTSWLLLVVVVVLLVVARSFLPLIVPKGWKVDEDDVVVVAANKPHYLLANNNHSTSLPYSTYSCGATTCLLLSTWKLEIVATLMTRCFVDCCCYCCCCCCYCRDNRSTTLPPCKAWFGNYLQRVSWLDYKVER